MASGKTEKSRIIVLNELDFGGSSSIQIYIPSRLRAFMFLTSTANNGALIGIYSVVATSGGVVTITPLYAASAITTSKTTNKLTLTSSVADAAFCTFIALSESSNPYIIT